MCAPRYIIVEGGAPEESINKFLEDYLPDGWKVSWNPRGSGRIVLTDGRLDYWVIGSDHCIVYDRSKDVFNLTGLDLLVKFLIDPGLVHVSPMEGLHHFRECIELNGVKYRGA